MIKPKLSFINSPPPEYSTILTALQLALKKANDGNQKICFVTFDQPLYWKARDIIEFADPSSPIKDIVVILGGFHLLMSCADGFKNSQPKSKKTTAAISAAISRACATSVVDSEGSIMASPTKRKIGGNAGARVEEPTVDLTHEEPSKVMIDEVAKLRSVTNKLTEFLVGKAGLEKATLHEALVIAGDYQDIIVRRS